MEESRKKKILLIEDDVFMVELLVKDFEAAGFEVIAAKTGAEGLESFEKQKPDVILLDIILPDQGGFEILRQIRRTPEGANVKVLVLSNISESPDIEEAKRLGALEYMVKANLTLPEIIEKVQKCLKI